MKCGENKIMKCIEFNLNDNISVAEYILDKHTEIIVLSHGLGGSGGTIYSFYEYFDSKNKGVFSFDYPCHGYREEKYTSYNVDNCLKTLDEVYKYLIKKYPDKKISFLATSMGSLYLYKYLMEKKPKVNKILFKCMPLNNKKTMSRLFINNDTKGKDYFTINTELKLPKKLIDDLDKTEKSLTDIKYIDKSNLLFVHGTNDEIADIKYIKDFCKKYDYNLKEIEGANHNFKTNNTKPILIKIICEFLGE